MESSVGRWKEQYLAPYLFNEYLELVGDRIDINVAGSFAEMLTECADLEIPLASLAARRRRLMLTGGFPELLLVPRRGDEATALFDSQRILRSDAVERAIYKDIPQTFGIDNPMLLERMLYILGGQVAARKRSIGSVPIPSGVSSGRTPSTFGASR
jgi:predicted AAA+ superfamily ATPase